MSGSNRLLLFMIAAFSVAALSYRIGMMPLSADEPIRALIALDMEFNGHYIAPEINGDPYFKKPPLYNYILLAFFKMTGSHSEWVVRLPSLLSAFLFCALLFYILYRHHYNSTERLFVPLAWLSSGNLLFYSSYLGHIDITYSLISFAGIYSLYHFGKDRNWLAMYISSYLFCAIGFLMKGLPSLVFQGLSLPIYIMAFQQFKVLLRREHIAGLLAFALPVAWYLYLFSREADIGLLAQTLIEESTSRTVGEKPLWASIQHILTFPFLFMLDTAPYGLLLPLLFFKAFRPQLRENALLRFSVFMLIGNVWIYWLSPDYRARYVFMLIPFLILILLEVSRQLSTLRTLFWFVVAFAIALFLLPVAGALVDLPFPFTTVYYLIAAVSVLLLWQTYRARQYLLLVPLMLFSARLLYTECMMPLRVSQSPFQKEKNEALEMARITKNQRLEMYHSNVNLTMAWYLSTERGQIPTTQRHPTDMYSYYIVPDEILNDEDNAITYYTFVRRHLNQPFRLVRFRYYFPEMPKYE